MHGCLVLHHEPTSLTRSAGLPQELLNFSFEGETVSRVAQFDRDIDRYQKASCETFPENIHVGVTLRMLPDGPLKQHFVLNSARLTTWELLKAEIDSVRRAQAAASSAPQPMDLSAYGTQNLDAFQKGKSRGKGKGKDKGNPKDNVPTTPCSICGKAGHLKKNCWYNIPGGWKETNKPKDKSKGKDGKDRTSANTPQQSNKNKNNVGCWNCNGQGHFSKHCPKKKQSLSPMESQEQPSSILWCGWRDNVEWFLLECLRERGRAEPLQIQDRGCHGDLLGAARSVVLAGEIPGFSVERDSETSRVYTSATGARVRSGETADPGNTGRQSAMLERASGGSQEEPHGCVRHVCGWTSCRVRLRQQQEGLESRRKQADWREDLLQVAKPCVGTRSQHHPKSGNGGHPDKDARAESRGVVSFRGAGTLSVSPEDPVGSGPVRDDREQEGRGVMAQATAHHEVPADHDPACEPSAIKARAVPVGPTRQEREDHNAAGHVPCRSCCRACVAGRGRSDAHLTSRSFVSATTTVGIVYVYLEDKVTLGDQEAAPSPILVTRSSTTQVTTADVLPCKGTAHPWCVQALVRAIVATGHAQIILRSDNEPAILDLKRQAAAECRVRHGMTMIIDDTTEYESQDNGLAEMAVREVKGVARSVKNCVERAVQERYQFEAPGVVLARLLRCRTDHARTDWSRWVDTASKTERESVPKAASCLCRVRPLPPHWQESKSSPGTLERWIVSRSR